MPCCLNINYKIFPIPNHIASYIYKKLNNKLKDYTNQKKTLQELNGECGSNLMSDYL